MKTLTPFVRGFYPFTVIMSRRNFTNGGSDRLVNENADFITLQKMIHETAKIIFKL